jgi:antitoxin CptB
MQGDDRLGRLQWFCRRGMKELDVLLEAFLSKHSEALTSGAWTEFESFLDQEDDEVWATA